MVYLGIIVKQENLTIRDYSLIYLYEVYIISMSNIVRLIYNRFFSRHAKVIMIVFFVVLFAYMGYRGYKKYYKEVKQVKEFSDVANNNSRKKTAEVLFFSADWCPHCKKAKPEWEQFKEEYDGKDVNDYTISCQSVDCTNEKDPKTETLIAKYKVESYPTIIMLVGDNRIDYDAKVTKSGLEQLVLSVTSR